ncbi:hypothetical protein GGF43_001439 [Coemansia sp. RSA 2618]|nr:hypothetical protein GGF43_001439 [Coemansia sp. RSA 2618]
MSFDWRGVPSYSHGSTSERPDRNVTTPNVGPSAQTYPEKHERLQQRLHEVLEDNTRLAALLDDARLQIEQLHSENVSLRDRLLCTADRSASGHMDRPPLPSMHTPVTTEVAANAPMHGQNRAAPMRPNSALHLPAFETTHGPLSAPAAAYRHRPWADDPPYGHTSYCGSSSGTGLRRTAAAGQQHSQITPCYSDSALARSEAREALPSICNPTDRSRLPLTPSDDHAGNAPARLDATLRVPGKRRKRHHDIASKVRSVQPVPRDSNGNYEMPVQVGILVVLNLGKVIWDRDAFHNERYIWPVGYTVQREYYSMVDPHRDVIYTCWVSEGKDSPLFHIEAEDMPDAPIMAPTATGAWTTVLRKVNQIRRREHSNSASGPDYFGFSHPTIAKMIQDLHGVARCRTYVMQNFVEMKERHVRGVVKKGRGGRPSIEMLSRGQRALMTVSAPASSPPSGRASQPEEPGFVRRISVATLTNADNASEPSTS